MFSHADLVAVDFSDSDLTAANFSYADMGVKPRASRTGGILSPPIFSGARISWCAGDLTSELLRRAAGDDLDKLHAAGLVLMHRHWPWEQFIALGHPKLQWAFDRCARTSARATSFQSGPQRHGWRRVLGTAQPAAPATIPDVDLEELAAAAAKVLPGPGGR